MVRRVRLRLTAPGVVIPLAFLLLPGLTYAFFRWMGYPHLSPAGQWRTVAYGLLGGLLMAVRWNHDTPRQRRLLLTGIPTEGTVAESLRRAHLVKLKVRYEVDGSVYEGITGGVPDPKGRLPGEGGKVQVYVDPKDPTNFAVVEISPFLVIARP